MTKRRLMRKKTDQRVFRITANRTHEKNLPQINNRGGIRM